MIRSMTAYGKSSGEFNGNNITVVISSLNSKSLNINCSLPEKYGFKELEVRNLITESTPGGKIYVQVSKKDGKNNTYTFNKDRIKKYYSELKSIQKELNEEGKGLLSRIIDLPGVMDKDDDENDKEWEYILKKVEETLETFETYSISEGKSLEKDLKQNVDQIESFLEGIKGQDKERKKNIRQKLENRIKEFDMKGDVDKSRLEQEVFFYLEKIDINEEQVRLKNHCDYFKETLKSNPPVGKKLGFISQEMLREINTIGSKANDYKVQQIVVQMKEHQDKIREQISNVL